MSLSYQLKTLAKGINPETGEYLDQHSVVNNIDTVRLLFALAEELDDLEDVDKPKRRKSKLTPEERRTKNIAENKPANTGFPWKDEDKQALAKYYVNLDSINLLSKQFARSPLAIAAQLEKLHLISKEDVEKYRNY